MHFAVVRLHVYAGDIQLETATGFFMAAERDGQQTHFLVTNWHVLSGRKPNDPGVIRHSPGGLPDNIRLSLHHANSAPGVLTMEEVTLPLFAEDGAAVWWEHPTLGRRCDLGVIDLRTQLVDRFRVETVGEVANSYDMAIRLGGEVFIIGYPLGFSHFARTPIWKRGSIASEPHIEDERSEGRVVIDATTRGGMSGSPVVLRAATHFLSESGEVRQAPGAMRFLGVYSSRPAFEEPGGAGPLGSEVTAEIGYFIKSGYVTDTMLGQTPAAAKGVVPD